MVYEQVGHKGGPFAHKPWCMSKWGIRGDPLLKSMVYDQVGHKGDPLLQKTMVYEQVGHKAIRLSHARTNGNSTFSFMLLRS